ncbi:DUF2855 family protein [Parvularcula lutaonensis]|uniref:DUF2855 family protein n=1 Tax=Parvularcula lutaonensis TaxID=491923 RepID=A0ABV7MCA3_9PROT|nr:DUF2855 family protein [Parvularcula lutaonensis]GGY50317.1 hypothetical protein GCM10007148_18880 [Parvularcula lutaonensis]
MITELRVKRGDLADAQLVQRETPELAEGEALLEVESFGLTANNVTYGIVGEQIGYWQFFPTDDAPETGIIPVWGFGRVVRSNTDELKEGERLFGYFPMATHVVMKPKRKGGVVFDTSEHRAALPPTYNAYRLTAEEPEALKQREDARSVLFPLFATSYVIADWLDDNDFFGAEQVVVMSASSKTGFGTGAAIKRLGKDVRTVGVTSAKRVDFVRSLNAFDEVVSYDDIESIDASKPTALIDMSGNAEVITRVHNHLGDNVKVSSIVGATHWDAPRQKEPLPGAKPTMFFAPAQIQKRDKELGPGEFMRQALEAWLEISDSLGDRLTYEHHKGPEATRIIWKDTVAGTVDPSRGIVASLNKD